jgi:hypothetical protein
VGNHVRPGTTSDENSSNTQERAPSVSPGAYGSSSACEEWRLKTGLVFWNFMRCFPKRKTLTVNTGGEERSVSKKCGNCDERALEKLRIWERKQNFPPSTTNRYQQVLFTHTIYAWAF